MSSKTILTSFNKIGGGGFKWASGVLANLANWAPGHPKTENGDCTGILKLMMQVVPCDTVAEFICESTNIEKTSMLIMLRHLNFN